jgi:hypothetical protein
MGLTADQTKAGDPVTAMLLAREGLPDTFAPVPDRPVVAGFWPVLHDALAAQREILILRGHEGWVTSAGFSPDGTRIVTASGDNTARVWMADGRGEPLVLRGHEDAVNWAGFSPDGTRIVTGSDDRTVRVWPLVQDLPALAQLAWQRIAPLRSLSEAQKRRFFIEDALLAANAGSP